MLLVSRSLFLAQVGRDLVKGRYCTLLAFSLASHPEVLYLLVQLNRHAEVCAA
jgi:hypothetical protein